MQWRTLLVVAIALLAISAQPAAAQNATAVADSHTTFGTGSVGEPAPTQLTNTSIDGSGTSASVQYQRGAIDTFEDGDVSEWSVGSESFSAVQSPVYEGTFAGRLTSSGQVSRQTSNRSGTVTISYAYRTSDASSFDNLAFYNGDGSDYGAIVGTESGEWFYYESSSSVQSGVSVSPDTWYLVRVEMDLDADTYSVYVDGTAIATGISLNNAANVDEIGELSLTGNGVGVSIDRIAAGATLADSGTYVGAPLSGEKVETGWTNLTLQNANATVTWQEDGDGNGAWTNVTSTTYTTTANVTADLSATTSDRWRVRVDFAADGADPLAELNDEGLLFDSASPSLSDPEPPDEMKIQNATGNVSINVSDPDFRLAQGDSVSVSATDDEGNSLGTTTLTSNGTASFSYSSKAGENTIQWTATDAYGTTDSFTQTFTTPANLTIRNESDTSQLVAGTDVSVELRFYAGDEIYTRSTSDGTINLAGLPADARFAVVVSADGYYRRRVIIDSLFEQQTIYLLPTSAAAVEKQFVLNDVSGNFNANSTRLYVQRSINNSTTYRTVAADYFGATSAFSTYLLTDQRYRLVIENDQGDRRTLGSYTPVAAGVEPLKIEGVGLYQQSQEGYIANASTRFADNGTQRQVVVRYRDPAAATSQYTVRIYERANESNVTYSETVSGPVQNYSAYVDVKNNTNYVVNWSATRNDQQIGGMRPVGGGDLGLRIPLPEQWLGTIGLVMIVFIGSLAGERYATHLALAVVAFAGVLMYLAVIDLFIPGWWGALLVAAGGHLAQRRPAS